MSELNKKRTLKLINPNNPDYTLIREMVQQSIEFVEDHSEILVVETISLDDIYNLLPDEIISINQCYIQKVIAFHTNFIAIGEWMEDDAKLYTIMFASSKPDAFVYDVKNDFGIEIKR